MSGFCERTLNHGFNAPTRFRMMQKREERRKKERREEKNYTEPFVFNFVTLNLHYTAKEDLVYNTFRSILNASKTYFRR